MNQLERSAFDAFVKSVRKTQLPGLDGMFAVGMIFIPSRPIPAQPQRICCVWLDQVAVEDRRNIVRVMLQGLEPEQTDGA